jgi:hypothetical protein
MILNKILKRILRYALLYRDKNTYSADVIIKDYCGYPKSFRLPQIQHGWYLRVEPWERDLTGATHLFLAWNLRMQEAWVKRSKVPVVVIGAPFIHYRRRNKIVRSSSARGTIAFPVHSSPNFKAVYNLKEYCKKLLELPKEYKPITICLGYHDMLTSIRHEYEEYGFNVVCAGDPYDKNFVKYFYQILKENNYSTSNRIGSYVMYSVEMGIPFFLYADDISFHHVHKTNDKKFNPPKDISSFVNKLFKISDKDIHNGMEIRINKAQRNFIISESGIEDCISPQALKLVLLKTYFLKSIPMAIFRILFAPFIIIHKLLKTKNVK